MILPFGKPERLVSDRALARYRAAHPRCEVCARPACPQPHHLVSRKLGRNDAEENLISLCVDHHRSWHTVGPLTWFQRFAAQLLPHARGKVARRLRLEGGDAA